MDLDVPNAPELSPGVVRSVIHSPGVVPTIVKTKNIRKKSKYIRKKCPHDHWKQHCKICTPQRFCIHNTLKHICQKCGNPPIKQYLCEHNRAASRCKECRGDAVKKRKYSVCVHNAMKQTCKICSPDLFCIHNRPVFTCTLCKKGGGICVHNMVKYTCEKCPRSGEALAKFNASKQARTCIHGKNKHTCTKCPRTGEALAKFNAGIQARNARRTCVHGKNKYTCTECTRSGTALAAFNASNQAREEKRTCINCIEWPDAQYKNYKYGQYCCRCFVRLFPEDPKSINSRQKIKEVRVKEQITLHFADYEFIHDKGMSTGTCCSHRRSIDHRCMLGNTMLCIETDEFAHRSYDKNDEENRYSDLFMATSCKYIFIRFNPDQNKEARCAKTDFDAKLSVLMPFMRAQIQRIEEGANTELVEIHKLFCCRKCLENDSALCVCEGET